jgi:hypothetical protein
MQKYQIKPLGKFLLHHYSSVGFDVNTLLADGKQSARRYGQ